MNGPRLQALFQTIDDLSSDELEQTYAYLLERRVQITHARLMVQLQEPLPKRHPFSTTPGPDADYYDTSWEGDS
jgi:Mor family transcriptional regulator